MKKINPNDYIPDRDVTQMPALCNSMRHKSGSDRALFANATRVVVCQCDGTAKAVADCLANLKIIRNTPEGGINMAENMYACAMYGQHAIEHAIKPR
jgi:hypothetical protein